MYLLDTVLSTKVLGVNNLRQEKLKNFTSRHVIFDESVLTYSNPAMLDSFPQVHGPITTYSNFLNWQLLDSVQESLPKVANKDGPHERAGLFFEDLGSNDTLVPLHIQGGLMYIQDGSGAEGGPQQLVDHVQDSIGAENGT